MTAAAREAMTALGRALGCTVYRTATAPSRALPEQLYYDGNAMFVERAPVIPIDATAAATLFEQEAARLRREDDTRRKRFFAGRYSVRLRRVVRPL